jgi:hypothetical protein
MMVRCNVHCRGHTPPPSPVSAALCRSEDKFAQEVIDVCQRHAADWTSAQFCEWVQNLDVQVQTGSVRRQAAAFAATCTHPSATRSVSCNLLYVVLHRGRNGHVNPCHCVDTVLGWGTCPTLVYVVPTGRVLGALGLDIEWTRHMHANMFAWGTSPWMYHTIWEAYPGAQPVLFPSSGTGGWARAQKHWRRWHARRPRQCWLMLAAAGHPYTVR